MQFSKSWIVSFVVLFTACTGSSALAEPTPPPQPAQPSLISKDEAGKLIIQVTRKAIAVADAKKQGQPVPFYKVDEPTLRALEQSVGQGITEARESIAKAMVKAVPESEVSKAIDISVAQTTIDVSELTVKLSLATEVSPGDAYDVNRLLGQALVFSNATKDKDLRLELVKAAVNMTDAFRDKLRAIPAPKPDSVVAEEPAPKEKKQGSPGPQTTPKEEPKKEQPKNGVSNPN
jgi:hypothetical protein